jgi:hypothetical protein
LVDIPAELVNIIVFNLIPSATTIVGLLLIRQKATQIMRFADITLKTYTPMLQEALAIGKTLVTVPNAIKETLDKNKFSQLGQLSGVSRQMKSADGAAFGESIKEKYPLTALAMEFVPSEYATYMKKYPFVAPLAEGVLTGFAQALTNGKVFPGQPSPQGALRLPTELPKL